MKRPDSHFDLEGAIAEFYAQCPHLRDRIMFIDPATVPAWNRDRLVEETSRKLLPESTPDHIREKFNAEAKRSIETQNISNNYIKSRSTKFKYNLIICPPSNWTGKDINDFCLNLLQPGTYNDTDFKNKLHHFIFDHELAHALDSEDNKSSKADKNWSECIADSYATLRHIQRYGDNDGSFIEMWKQQRVLHAILYDHVENYTSPAIEATKKWAFKNKLQGQLPEVLLNIAREITVETYNEHRIHDLEKALHPTLRKKFIKATTTGAHYKAAGRKFLSGAKNLNSPHLEEIWQKWRQALTYFDLKLPEEKTLPRAQRASSFQNFAKAVKNAILPK